MTSKFSQAFLTHTKRWYLIDAQGQKVGRLACLVANALRGKTKPTFHPSALNPDHIVVINAKDVVFTGKKWDQKLYTWHTGWPGGFRQEKAADLHERRPTEVVRRAVSGMLPKNNLRKQFLRHLHIFENEEHPYDRNIFQELQPPQEPVPPLPELYVIRTVESEDEIEPIPGCEYQGETILYESKQQSS